MKQEMGKKKSQESYQDLKTLIESNSDFFDNLVKLIPPKFYIHDPNDNDKLWFQGLSKVAKSSAKKLSRKNLKKSRCLRFNLHNPSSTLDLFQKSIKSDQNPGESGIENPITKSEDRSITYEELQQKIEEAKLKRNTRQNDEPRNYQKKKREIEEKNEENEKKGENLVADIEFGKVKIGGEGEKGKKKKKKILKFKELDKAKRLEELKKDLEKDEAIAKKHSWKASKSRAIGVKVHDDPKLLRESIKKEKRRKKKNAEKWKERVESRDSVMKEKYKARTENIRDRAQQKKIRRIKKREKKLMRPGFKGRKERYINE